jgi:predicted nucleic acid-binding Zn ribbon protein
MTDGSPEGTPLPDDATADEAAAAVLRRVTRSTARAKPRSTRPPAAAFSDDRDPQPLSAALERLVRDQGWEADSAVALLMGEWDQIVGRDLAEHVAPLGFTDGELTLQAVSTTWATQVRLLLPQVQRAIDERVGRGVVRRIRIMGPQAPSWTSGPRRVPGRGPRDTYG